MVDFYIARIKAGKMTVDEVPPRWRDAVMERLEEIT